MAFNACVWCGYIYPTQKGKDACPYCGHRTGERAPEGGLYSRKTDEDRSRNGKKKDCA